MKALHPRRKTHHTHTPAVCTTPCVSPGSSGHDPVNERMRRVWRPPTTSRALPLCLGPTGPGFTSRRSPSHLGTSWRRSRCCRREKGGKASGSDFLTQRKSKPSGARTHPWFDPVAVTSKRASLIRIRSWLLVSLTRPPSCALSPFFGGGFPY